MENEESRTDLLLKDTSLSDQGGLALGDKPA